MSAISLVIGDFGSVSSQEVRLKVDQSDHHRFEAFFMDLKGNERSFSVLCGIILCGSCFSQRGGFDLNCLISFL